MLVHLSKTGNIISAIISADGSKINSDKGESEKSFKTRLKAMIDLDYMAKVRFTTKPYTRKKNLKKRPPKKRAVKKAVTKAVKAKRVAAKKVKLAKPKIEVPKEPVVIPEAETVKVKGKRLRGRPRKKKLPLEIFEQQRAQMNKNIGRKARFIPFRQKRALTGVVVGTYFDKRVPMVMYKFKMKRGGFTHTKPNNSSLEWQTEPVN